MVQALLNTAMGLVIVFSALIFISFCIYLLRFIPQLIELFSGNKEKETSGEVVVKNESAVTAANKVEVSKLASKTDDTELIAVISAAIAAAMSESMGQTISADGLVIRKIKRRRV